MRIENQKLLIEAFDFYAVQKCKTLPSDEVLSPITFSESLEEKMQRLIARQKKSWFYLVNTAAKKVAVIILAVLIGVTATTFSVKSLRQSAIKFITETYEKFTRIIFVNDTDNEAEGGSNDGTIIFEPVYPSYIPEGFTLTNSMDLDVLVMREYKNAAGEFFTYDQQIKSDTSININTEQAEYKYINISGYDGVVYKFENETTIIFSNEYSVFSITGTVFEDELKKIAESIIKK